MTRPRRPLGSSDAHQAALDNLRDRYDRRDRRPRARYTARWSDGTIDGMRYMDVDGLIRQLRWDAAHPGRYQTDGSPRDYSAVEILMLIDEAGREVDPPRVVAVVDATGGARSHD